MKTLSWDKIQQGGDEEAFRQLFMSNMQIYCMDMA